MALTDKNLIDVTRLISRRILGRLPTGIDRVSLEYVRHFSRRSTALIRLAGLWVELSRQDSESVFEALLSNSGKFKRLILCVVFKSLPHSFLGKKFSDSGFFFNTGHSGLEREDYARRLKESGLKPIFFVHDLIPLSHPEYCRPGEAGRHSARINTLLRTGRGLIVNSTATLHALSAYACSNSMPMPPAAVAFLAPARLPFPVGGSPFHKPYFVMIGTIEPRKNHGLVLNLWRQLIERLGDDAPILVIIGQRGWECENVVDLLERCNVLTGFVIERPVCNDTELSLLLTHARALLFPSFIEGFGMPLVEALSLGVPVIASDLPAFREIAEDIPEYVDPLDGKRWGELVIEYASTDSRARFAQCQRITHFIPPTWVGHFERVESFMLCLSDDAVEI